MVVKTTHLWRPRDSRAKQPYLVVKTSSAIFKDAISGEWVAEQGVMMVVEGGGDKTIGFKDLWLIRMWDPQVLAHVVWEV